MATIKTHLPHSHLAPEISCMNWQYDGDVVHFELEEPLGIMELDIYLVVGLRKDGTVSDDMDDILTAQAVSCKDDSKFELEPELAHDILTNTILPYIESKFPSPAR